MNRKDGMYNGQGGNGKKVKCPGNPRKPGGSHGMPKKAKKTGTSKKPSRQVY